MPHLSLCRNGALTVRSVAKASKGRLRCPHICSSTQTPGPTPVSTAARGSIRSQTWRNTPSPTLVSEGLWLVGNTWWGVGNGGKVGEVQVFLPEAKVIHLLCDILAENGGGWDLPEGVNPCRENWGGRFSQIHLHTWFSTESLIWGYIWRTIQQVSCKFSILAKNIFLYVSSCSDFFLLQVKYEALGPFRALL